MKRIEIEKIVKECFQRVASEQGIEVKSFSLDQRVAEDIGFQSLDVATVTAFLGVAFKVDPFAQNIAAITEIRTLGDVCDLYEKCLTNVQPFVQDVALATEDERLARRLKRNAG